MAGWGNLKILQIHSSQMKEKLDRLVNKENQQHVQEVSSMQVGRYFYVCLFFCGKIVFMFVSSLFCCLSFFNIGPVLIVDLNNAVFAQAMLEETLTKNLHLQQDLEHMSQVTVIVFFGLYLPAPYSLNQSK